MVEFIVSCREVNIVNFVIKAEDKFEAKKLAYRKLDYDDIVDWTFSNYDIAVFEKPVTIQSKE